MSPGLSCIFDTRYFRDKKEYEGITNRRYFELDAPLNRLGKLDVLATPNDGCALGTVEGYL